MKITTTRMNAFILTFILLAGSAVEAAGGESGAGLGSRRIGSGGTGQLFGRGTAFGIRPEGYGTRGVLPDRTAAEHRAVQDIFLRQKWDLNRALHKKQLLLQRERATLHPDKSRVIRLQNQITGIRSELDRKTLQHRLETIRIDSRIGTGPSPADIIRQRGP